MKIVVAGGGSGGHLTPLIAVGEAVKKLDSSIKIIHIGQKDERLHDIVNHHGIDASHAIQAGKFRRYHGESLLQHVTDFHTIALNIRDFFKFAIGVVQAWMLLKKLKPDVIFLKGGFVCVPVGYAARILHIPYITHDSDAVPGLANRLTAKHAHYNTTALNPELYPYDRSKTIQVGIPIQSEYTYVRKQDKSKAKKALDIPQEARVVLSVGGGLGAQRLNHAVVRAAEELLADKLTYIIHLTGKNLFKETVKLYEKAIISESHRSRVRLIDFSTKLYELSSAADVVITRAGATNIAEFALQAKPCVVVPNPVLTGGQQLHNADVLVAQKAAIVLQEAELPSLAGVVRSLLHDEKLAESYGSALHAFAVSDSADRIARLLIGIAEGKPKVDIHEVVS